MPKPLPVSVIGRWTAPLALVIAVAAAATAACALMHSQPKDLVGIALPGDPKIRVCSAFGVVTTSVSGQTHADLGPDPVAKEAVAGNARLALIGGGQYLLSRLDSATPPTLADPVRAFANDLQDIGLYALAAVPNGDPSQATRLIHADQVRNQIMDLCK